MTLSNYINRSSSEKYVLAKIKPKKRLVVWTLDSGSIYKKTVSDIPSAVWENGTALTEVGSTPTGAGEWYFDRSTFTLYVWAADSNDPSTNFTTVFFDIFLSTRPFNLPRDLASDVVVPWLGLIKNVSPTKQQLDDQQRGITLESSGSLTLINDLAFWQSRFDQYIWEDANVEVWLHSDVLGLANRVKLFQGRVTTKRWSDQSIVLSFRDFSFELRDKIDTPLFDGTDTLIAGGSVSLTKEQFLIPKRRVYGRVAGLWLECLDNEGTGSSLTGTLSGTASSATITVNSGDADNELSVGDTITVASQDVTIKTFAKLDIGLSSGEVTLTNNGSDITLAGAGSTTLDFSTTSVNDKIILDFQGLDTVEKGIYNVDSKTATTATLSKAVGSLPATGTFQVNSGEVQAVKEGLPTSFEANEELTVGFTTQAGTVKSKTPRRDLHREWLVAHHECYEPSYTITGVNTGKRTITLSDASGLFVGDKVVIGGTSKTIEAKNVNTVTIVETIPGIIPGSSFTKSPIQALEFEDQVLTEGTAFTVNQTQGDCRIVLEDDAEFTGAVTIEEVNQEVTVTNGSNVIYSNTRLFSTFKSRDWFTIDGGTDWYEIMEVIAPNCAIVRTTISESSNNYASIKTRQPEYLVDGGKLIANVYGATENGDKTGTLIENAPQAVKDILSETSVTVNTASFDSAQDSARSLLSLAIPQRRRDIHPSRKEVINVINKSVQGSLTNNIDFEAEYSIFTTERLASSTKKISTTDLIGRPKISSDSKFQLSKLNVSYRLQDFDTETATESTEEKLEVSNTDFSNTDRAEQGQDITLALYNQVDADAFARRILLIRSLSRQTIEVTAASYLIDVELNDVVELELQNQFDRFGGTNKKVGIVSSLSHKLGETTIRVEDLGNIFNRTGTITPNGASDFSAATSTDKLFNAYITDDNGVTDNDEETIGTMLIQ